MSDIYTARNLACARFDALMDETERLGVPRFYRRNSEIQEPGLFHHPAWLDACEALRTFKVPQ